MKKYFAQFLLVIALLFVLACENKEELKPNIIYILADDLGYGDLGCYGQSKFKTPNIDLLSEQGMRFTQHYSGATVCAPSRSALLTGLHTGHTLIRGNEEIYPEGQYPLPDSIVTLPKLLQSAGYKTGAFGKWGLGYPGSEGEPNKQGFDQFFGYNCQRMGHNYYPFHLWENENKVLLQENAGDKEATYGPNLIHQKTLDFIEENKDEPFFLFVPSIIPHAELKVPEEYLARYRHKLEPEKEYQGCDPGCENFKIGGYGTQAETHAAFAGMIELLDDQVGEIVAKVKELGLEDNTLIIFTSDNGPHQEGGADPDYFDSNGPFKGYKRDLYEGGIRVPMIAKWPGKIKARSVSDHISAFWDVMPTFAELAEIPLPQNIDGMSFAPTLLGKNQEQHEYLYWEFHELGGRRAIRKGDWKLVQYNVNIPDSTTFELYNLSHDPGENNDISAENAQFVDELKTHLLAARTESDVFQFATQE